MGKEWEDHNGEMDRLGISKRDDRKENPDRDKDDS
jgi:hypothetical protein